MTNKTLIVLGMAFATVLLCQPLQAGIFGDGMGGAFRGAMLGHLIDGRDGAAAGAVIGGLIGAGRSASRQKRQRQQQQETQRRQAEWAAQQQANEERIRQQHAAAAPEQAAKPTLLVETQKSLIRLGYEPGALGSGGRDLTNAVTSYQRDKGLLETGELSQALLTHML